MADYTGTINTQSNLQSSASGNLIEVKNRPNTGQLWPRGFR